MFVTEATLQLSPVVGVPKLMLVASQEPVSVPLVTGAGQLIVGCSASVIVTTCEQVAVFPLASVTVQVTVVEPTG